MADSYSSGATGAIQLASLLPELKRQSQEVGVVSMCIGKPIHGFSLNSDTNSHRYWHGSCWNVRARIVLKSQKALFLLLWASFHNGWIEDGREYLDLEWCCPFQQSVDRLYNELSKAFFPGCILQKPNTGAVE
jgi:hypothetical protein